MRHDRPAEAAAAVVPVLRQLGAALAGLLAALFRKKFSLDQRVRPDLDVARAAITVGPGLRGHVEHAAAGPAHLRIVGVHLDFHFFDRLDARVRGGAVLDVSDGEAVEQVVVLPHAAAAQRDERGAGLILHPVPMRVAARHHRRHEVRHEKDVAADGGQLFHDLLLERLAGGRRSGFDERDSPVTVTVSSIAPTSSATSSVSACCVPMRTPFCSNVLKPVMLVANGVGAGINRGKHVLTGRVRHRLA